MLKSNLQYVDWHYISLYELNSLKCDNEDHVEVETSLCWFPCYDGFKSLEPA